jgi:phospholipid/cholesterol/gamma-HCH transport system permease protein
MQCGTNAAAVGQATTSAVVTGVTSIIAADGLFAVICNALHL